MRAESSESPDSTAAASSSTTPRCSARMRSSLLAPSGSLLIDRVLDSKTVEHLQESWICADLTCLGTSEEMPVRTLDLARLYQLRVFDDLPSGLAAEGQIS